MCRHGQYLPSIVLFALAICLFSGCDSGLFDASARTPTGAQYRERASGCEVEVHFSDSVLGREPMLPEYYRLPSGETALAVESVPEFHAVVVTFPTAVDASNLIDVGVTTTSPSTIAVAANPADEQPAQLLETRFIEDADEPTVLVIFDEALDVEEASDVRHYALAGTIDHPVSATITGCGLQVLLTFEELSATTVLDVTGLWDVNGLPVEDTPGLTVTADEEENRPLLLSATFTADAAATSIIVTFNEAVDSATARSPSNYTLLTTGINPEEIQIQGAGREVVLLFPSLNPPVSVEVDGVTDLNGNPISPVTIEVEAADIDQAPPDLASATVTGRDGGLRIQAAFSEALAAAAAEQTDNYLLRGAADDDGITPKTALLLDGGSVVELAFDYLPPAALLEVTGVYDLSGNVAADSMAVPVYEQADAVAPQVASLTFLPDEDTPTVEVTFDKALEESSAQDTANYVLDTGETPTSAELRADGRTVRLVLPPVDRTAQLSISFVADEAGNVVAPAESQAIGGDGDTSSPVLESVEFVADNVAPTIQVVFSEAVDKSSAQTLSNYTTTLESRFAVSAAVQPDGHTVLLTMGPTQFGTQLQVANVTDLAGNAIVDATASIGSTLDSTPPTVETATFVANTTAPTVDVVFTEAVDESSAESAGLYLTSSDNAPAQSATVSDDGRTVRLVFPPIETDDTLEIRSVWDLSGNVMTAEETVSIQPASDENRPFVTSAGFTTDGTAPTVVLVFNEAVDESAAETLSNYRTTSGSDNPTNAVMQTDCRTVNLTFGPMDCEDALVVSDITDFAGNSVDDSLTTPIAAAVEINPPTISSATVTDVREVTIVFSEAVDESSAETIGNYTRGSRGLAAYLATLQTDGKTVVLLTTGSTPAAGDTMTVANVSDLSGNVMATVISLTLE